MSNNDHRKDECMQSSRPDCQDAKMMRGRKSVDKYDYGKGNSSIFILVRGAQHAKKNQLILIIKSGVGMNVYKLKYIFYILLLHVKAIFIKKKISQVRIVQIERSEEYFLLFWKLYIFKIRHISFISRAQLWVSSQV